MRLCIYCEHFRFDEGWGGTDLTPGDPPRFICGKSKFNLMPESTREHRQILETGLTCTLFEKAKD